MSPEQLQAKLAHLADALEKLRALPHESLEQFRSDDRNLDAALHRLQIAIQVLIDVGSHVVSQLGLGAPSSSHDVLERLERAGRIPPGATIRFGRMFAFRNRIVHLYDRVDDTFVFEIMTAHLDELGELATLYLDALS
jgi:uncharacterized protein YutE (UPF0331/DUF86 family)